MSGEGLLSIKPVVEFLNIEEYYSFNDDLLCKYKFNDYEPKEGDRIGIFKLGWVLVKDYIVFEWVNLNSCSSSPFQSVTFNRYILPKNSTDLYQICYISGENELKAATSTFQFVANVNNVSTIKPKERKFIIGSGTASEPLPDPVQKLKEENEILRESLKAVLAQKDAEKSNSKDVEELKTVVNDLKDTVQHLQKDVNMLKKKIVEGGEEYRKLYMEKLHVEKKYDKLKQQQKKSDKVISKDMINSFDINELKSIPPFPFN